MQSLGGPLFPSSNSSVPGNLMVLHWTPWFWVFRERRCKTWDNVQDLLWARFGGSMSHLSASQWSEHNHTGTYSCKRGWEPSAIIFPRREWSWQTFSQSVPHLSIFRDPTKSLLTIQLLQAFGECLLNFYRTYFSIFSFIYSTNILIYGLLKDIYLIVHQKVWSLVRQ